MSNIRKWNFIGALLITMVLLAGCTTTGTATESGGAGSYLPIIIFIALMIAMMYFMTIRPQQKKQKEMQKLLESLRKGDSVITASGIYGKIERIGKESIVLEVESGATIRVTRNSIAGKIQQQ